MQQPDPLRPEIARAERPVRDVLLWAWILLLVLNAVLALHTTLRFDEITRDVADGERANIPDARDRITVATVVGLATVAIVVLRRFGVPRWPPLWLVVLASFPAAAVSVAYGLSLAALWT